MLHKLGLILVDSSPIVWVLTPEALKGPPNRCMYDFVPYGRSHFGSPKGIRFVWTVGFRVMNEPSVDA